MMGEEKRKHVRIFLPEGEVRLSHGMIFALAGRVVDISVGGTKFICYAELEPPSVIDLEITIPSEIKFKCFARIIYKEKSIDNPKESVYGVQFIDLRKEDQEILGKFIMDVRKKQDYFLKKKDL